MAPDLWRLIGLLELAGALGLLAGLVLPALGAAAALGGSLLMLGAVLAHLRVRRLGRTIVPPAVLLAIAVAISALDLARV